MTMLVLDPKDAGRIQARRRRLGLDRWDEVWDGVYVMSPLANNEHQQLGSDLTSVFRIALGWGIRACAGVNVSDRAKGWAKNYRCPDVAVFLPGTTAIDRGTHWQGGPDFAVEIASEHDRTREKFAFYAQVNVRELLIVDRRPWALELYRLQGGTFELVGRSTLDDPQLIESEVISFKFRLVPGDVRPLVELTHGTNPPQWLV